MIKARFTMADSELVATVAGSTRAADGGQRRLDPTRSPAASAIFAAAETATVRYILAAGFEVAEMSGERRRPAVVRRAGWRRYGFKLRGCFCPITNNNSYLGKF
ncbi:unnamed protein product [Cuscuta europaea]|uniref:Uncharacterized protein n=1 Tax=Cuscuta europaea TaxID=41803 RepID=A0A9P0ZJV4_CUSEU|nr:unnamed protein product [Cuscuta europaea]